MRIGMVGLGRMGANMVRRLTEHGHQVVTYDRSPEQVEASRADGAEGTGSLDELVAALEPPRAVWIMVPSGDPTHSTVAALTDLLASGDVIVNGGNSQYRDAQEAAAALRPKGIHFVDAGVSGGVWGLRNGYCLMVGGERDAVQRLEPVFRALAPVDGYAHVGPSGAGHYAKMIHNGIEYGLLQAYAEGFALLEAADELDFDLHELAKLWNHGSVVRSWLLELTELALANEDEFRTVKGYVEDSGEGRWTIEEALDRAVPVPVIASSLFARFSSRQADPYAARIVAALRNQFGGHGLVREAVAAEVAREADLAAEGAVGPEGSATGVVPSGAADGGRPDGAGAAAPPGPAAPPARLQQESS